MRAAPTTDFQYAMLCGLFSGQRCVVAIKAHLVGVCDSAMSHVQLADLVTKL